MKFCMDHWNELRGAIRDRGLESLVATSGQQAAAQTVAQLEGDKSAKTFDPLMAAHWAIVNRAMGMVGLAIMAPNDDGTDRCPLCFLVSTCECGLGDACHFKLWIPSVADYVRGEAIKLGAMPSDSSSPDTEGSKSP